MAASKRVTRLASIVGEGVGVNDPVEDNIKFPEIRRTEQNVERISTNRNASERRSGDVDVVFTLLRSVQARLLSRVDGREAGQNVGTAIT